MLQSIRKRRANQQTIQKDITAKYQSCTTVDSPRSAHTPQLVLSLAHFGITCSFGHGCARIDRRHSFTHRSNTSERLSLLVTNVPSYHTLGLLSLPALENHLHKYLSKQFGMSNNSSETSDPDCESVEEPTPCDPQEIKRQSQGVVSRTRLARCVPQRWSGRGGRQRNRCNWTHRQKKRKLEILIIHSLINSGQSAFCFHRHVT